MTTTESLACGLPMLIINPIPGQEEENAKFLDNNGIGIWIKTPNHLSKVLRHLLSNSNELNQMKNNALLFGHPNSTKDICSILLKNRSQLL